MKGASLEDMRDVYCKQVRSILEFGVPVWSNGITLEEVAEIERVQKSFLHIVLGKNYQSYEAGIDDLVLDTLEDRRLQLCNKFAFKSSKDSKHSSWFKPYENFGAKTRSTKFKYREPLGRLDRYKESPIPFLTNLLNGG